MTPRVECEAGHENPPYVEIEGLYCETCNRDLPGKAGGPTFPLEICAECIRSGLTECATCRGVAIRWTQAVPA